MAYSYLGPISRINKRLVPYLESTIDSFRNLFDVDIFSYDESCFK